MSSVTIRIKNIKQPIEGYVSEDLFKKSDYQDNTELNTVETLQPSLVNLAVDYLTRYLCGNSKVVAFNISMMGAAIVKDHAYAMSLLSGIKGLDDQSIINATKLVGYDSAYRSGTFSYLDVRGINTDEKTIANIRTMVIRSLQLFRDYGPVTKVGVTFGEGYTNLITRGDCDFLTRDTLWGLTFSNEDLSDDNTLQMLVYYLMGKRSGYEEFDFTENIGIFNPRINKSYILKVSDISDEIIEEVKKNVIGYGEHEQLRCILRNEIKE